MTEVTINAQESNIVHKVGNYYMNKEYGLHILCNVGGTFALVSALSGWFLSESVKLKDKETFNNISQDTFNKICVGNKFSLVDKVTIEIQ